MSEGLLDRVLWVAVDRTSKPVHDRARIHRLLGEAIRFAVVGVIGVALDIGLFNVLRHEGVGPLTAKAASTTFAALVSYVLNRRWSFSHTAHRGAGRELPLFILLSAVGLGIAEGCLAVSHYGLGLHTSLADNVSANGFGLVLGTAWRLWSFKRWVFVAPEQTTEETLAAAVL